MLKYILIPCALILNSCAAYEAVMGSSVVENLERDIPPILAKDVLGAFVPEQSNSGAIFSILGACAMGYAAYLLKYKPSQKPPITPPSPPQV